MTNYLTAAGMFLTLLTPVAGAQDFSCASLEGVEPVSRYAQAVLDRADDGLQYAREAEAASDFLQYMPGWMLSIASTWTGLTDTDVQRIQTARELRDASACLQLDLALIDCKLEEVRLEQRAQSARGAMLGIIRLNELADFLNERRRHLQAGALDPEYIDPTWGDIRAFDPPGDVWCSPQEAGGSCTREQETDCRLRGGTPYKTWDACTATGTNPENVPQDSGIMCPFDADYAPAFDSGFGCDLETMEAGGRRSYPPLQAELEALDLIHEELEQTRSAADSLLELQRQIGELTGAEPTLPQSPPQREHLEAFGCGWSGGYCERNRELRCTTDEECGREGPCTTTERVCKGNRAIRCIDDAQCDGSGPCIDMTGDLELRSLRGVFSASKDELALLRSFSQIRSLQDTSRNLPDDLELASELPPDDPDLRRQRAIDWESPFFQIIGTALRNTVQSWSRVQSRMNTLIFPEAVDAPLEISHSLSDLHAAVSAFSRQASDREGVRDFITRFAYFLRISCTKRQCSDLLERAIRLSTTDECFPYANGDYLNDTEDNPRWQKCRDAAGIE